MNRIRSFSSRRRLSTEKPKFFKVSNFGRVVSTETIQHILAKDYDGPKPPELESFLEDEDERTLRARKLFQENLEKDKSLARVKKGLVHDIEMHFPHFWKKNEEAINLRGLGIQLQELISRVPDVYIQVKNVSKMHAEIMHVTKIYCNHARDFLQICLLLIPDPAFDEWGMDGWVTHKRGKNAFHIYNLECFKYSKIRIPDMWAGYQDVSLESFLSKESAKRVRDNALSVFQGQDSSLIYGDLDPDILAKIGKQDIEDSSDDSSSSSDEDYENTVYLRAPESD